MIQLVQHHSMYGCVPGYPEFYDFCATNFNLITAEDARGLARRCSVRVKTQQNGEELVLTFTHNDFLRIPFRGVLAVDDIDETAMSQIYEFIVEKILPQLRKTEDDDIVVLINVE